MTSMCRLPAKAVGLVNGTYWQAAALETTIYFYLWYEIQQVIGT